MRAYVCMVCVCVCFYKCPQTFFLLSYLLLCIYLFGSFFPLFSVTISYWNAERTSGIRIRVKLTWVSHASPLYTRPSTVHPLRPNIQAISAARKSAFSSLKRALLLRYINTTTLQHLLAKKKKKKNPVDGKRWFF